MGYGLNVIDGNYTAVKNEISEEGTCGEDLTWSLDSAGVLSISGNGSMRDYDYTDRAPWYDDAENIVEARFYGSVQSIGSFAFYRCTALEQINIPASVTHIGANAFRASATGISYAGTMAQWMNINDSIVPADCSDGYISTWGNCGTNLNYIISDGVISIHSVGDSDVLAATVDVDMREYSAVQIDVSALELDSQLVWKSSSTRVAKVDSNGLVSFGSPGKAVITAQGENSKITVTLNVRFLDKTTVFTASSDAPAVGLQTGETAQISVFGTDKSLALDSSAFSYSLSKTYQAYAEVDENGIVTAKSVTYPATVAVKVMLDGDPLARSTTAKVKIVPMQVQSIVVSSEIAETGNEIRLERADAEGLSFNVSAELFDKNGEKLPVSSKSIKWSSTDARIATVAANADGSATVTMKATSDGACNIIATSTDLAKAEGVFGIHVMDYAPRFEVKKLTLNPLYAGGVDAKLVASYENVVTDVAVLEYDKASDDYVTTERFEASYNDGLLNIRALTAIANSTVKLRIDVTCANENVYEYPISLTVKNSNPVISTKQAQKINLFYDNGMAYIAVNAGDTVIEDVKLLETENFTGTYDGTSGVLEISIAKYAQRPDTKAKLEVKLAGYAQPVVKALTIATETVKPRLVLSPSSSVVNANVGDTVSFRIIDRTNSVEIAPANAVVTASFAQVDTSGDSVVLSGITGSGTAKLAVTCEHWTQSVNISHKVTFSKSNPVAKLSSSSLKINRRLPTQTAVANISLNQINMNINDVVIENANRLTAYDNAEKLLISYADGMVSVSFKDQAELPAKGTYTFNLTAVVDGGIKLRPIVMKVNVLDAEPKMSLTASGKLDTLKRESEIRYTVSNITNVASYTFDQLKLVDVTGADADKFDASLDLSGTKPVIVLRQRADETYRTNVTYKLAFVLNICGKDVSSSVVNVRMSQSSLKFSTVPDTGLIFQSQSGAITGTLSITNVPEARIASIEPSSKTTLAFWKALGDYELDYELIDGGRSARLYIQLENPGRVTYGRSYSLYVNVTPENNAENVAPYTVLLKVTVKK